MLWNVLVEAVIRVHTRDGIVRAATLAGVLSALTRNEISAFPALRPHQRHA